MLLDWLMFLDFVLMAGAVSSHPQLALFFLLPASPTNKCKFARHPQTPYCLLGEGESPSRFHCLN